MRERLIRELRGLPHARFLVYLMGPYTAFDLENIMTDDRPAGELEPGSIPESVDFGKLVDSDHDLEGDEAVLDLLLYVRDRLRTESGVNAFLATDVDIPLSEMDAATQSIEFALASNAVVYVVPKVGDNLGVGIEVGSVLEAIFQADDRQTSKHRNRILFVHESGVRSAMIAAVQERWDARVYSYDDRDDLVEQVQLYVRDITRREQYGELSELDE